MVTLIAEAKAPSIAVCDGRGKQSMNGTISSKHGALPRSITRSFPNGGSPKLAQEILELADMILNLYHARR